MFKKTVFTILVASLVLVLFSSLTLAYSVQVASNYGPYQTGIGGEFTLDPSADLDWVLNGYASVAKNVPGYPGTFQSFCLETNEYISSGGVYDVTLSNAAVNGGVGGGSPDPLSRGTAYLYYNFANGSLADYDYTNPGRSNYLNGGTNTAALLQQAIWYLEDEINLANPLGNTFLAAAYGYFGNSWTTAKSANSGLFPVMVANLGYWERYLEGCEWKERWVNCQDQLVVTPIPGAIYLLGAGFLGLVGIRRKNKSIE